MQPTELIALIPHLRFEGLLVRNFAQAAARAPAPDGVSLRLDRDHRGPPKGRASPPRGARRRLKWVADRASSGCDCRCHSRCGSRRASSRTGTATAIATRRGAIRHPFEAPASTWRGARPALRRSAMVPIESQRDAIRGWRARRGLSEIAYQQAFESEVRNERNEFGRLH